MSHNNPTHKNAQNTHILLNKSKRKGIVITLTYRKVYKELNPKGEDIYLISICNRRKENSVNKKRVTKYSQQNIQVFTVTK